MTTETNRLLTLSPTPLKEINMNLVEYFIREYRAGNPSLSMRQVEIAKAAIALQEAYACKDYHVKAEFPTEDDEAELDAQAYQRATNAFNGGKPVKGVMWGVARHQLPRNTNPGEYITVHYKFLNELASAAGLVIAEYGFTGGKGVVIKLMETNNGFNLGKFGWRYASLWIPKNRDGMAGFLF